MTQVSMLNCATLDAREHATDVLLVVAGRGIDLDATIFRVLHGVLSLELTPARSSPFAVCSTLQVVFVELQNGARCALRLSERLSAGVRDAALVRVATLLIVPGPPVVDEPHVDLLNESPVALLVEPSARMQPSTVSSRSEPNVALHAALDVSIDPPVNVSSPPVWDAAPVPHVLLLGEPLVPLPVALFALVLAASVLDAVLIAVPSPLNDISARVVHNACIALLDSPTAPVSNGTLVTARDVSLEPALDRSCPPAVDMAHVSVVRLPDDPSERVQAVSFARRPDVSIARERPLDERCACLRPASSPRLLDLSFVPLPDRSFACVPNAPVREVSAARNPLLHEPFAREFHVSPLRMRDDSSARARAAPLALRLDFSVARNPPWEEPLTRLLNKCLVFVLDAAPILLLDESSARGRLVPFAPPARVLGDACAPLLVGSLGLGLDPVLMPLLDGSLARGLRDRSESVLQVSFARLREKSHLLLELPVLLSFDME
ncbi:hypothetical protein AURDEDRAFT_168162 [Auricularia subglabra TFB-10046 SS5]|nr:hypothetical protein AURDEDRAFT_168162 [Auricularia subglabra TFB-10046 SS5]